MSAIDPSLGWDADQFGEKRRLALYGTTDGLRLERQGDGGDVVETHRRGGRINVPFDVRPLPFQLVRFHQSLKNARIDRPGDQGNGQPDHDRDNRDGPTGSADSHHEQQRHRGRYERQKHQRRNPCLHVGVTGTVDETRTGQ